uniref:Lipase n=1 Tax=Ascaris suum TaxID=6253 RepID=F1KWB2_ASCSU
MWIIQIFVLILSRAYATPQANYVGDPEADMSVPEIIEHWGYPVETHSVITDDGYILLMHRIPHGKCDPASSNKPKPVVFLQHGLLCSSSVWVMNKPHQSAAFIFADLGFDVWMGNNRGNSYSRWHIKYHISYPEYWRFTWTEMAKYDLPAMIDGVLNATGRQSLYYVAHSQGTLIMFTKLAHDYSFNEKIRQFFAIAPVATMAYAKGLFGLLGGNMYNQFQLFYTLFGETEFLPNNFITRFITEFICGIASKDPLCENFVFLVSGPDSHQMNKTRIGVYLAHNPAGTSTKNIMHFAQMVHYGRHSPFDYEFPSINKQHYGTEIPPVYNITRISTPMYLYYSDADWVATGRDVRQYLLALLPSKYLRSVKKLDDFNHNDFLWGLRAAKEVFIPISAIIRKDHRRFFDVLDRSRNVSSIDEKSAFIATESSNDGIPLSMS